MKNKIFNEFLDQTTIPIKSRYKASIHMIVSKTILNQNISSVYSREINQKKDIEVFNLKFNGVPIIFFPRRSKFNRGELWPHHKVDSKFLLSQLHEIKKMKMKLLWNLT